MQLADLTSKSVAIIGFGKEGGSVLAAIRRRGIGCAVTVLDSKPGLTVEGADVVAGPGYLDGLDRFDVIVKSPGVPPSPQLEAVKGKTTSAVRLFFAEAAARGARIVGITGSKGKSTTTSLIYAILKAGGLDAVLVGNIGIPMLEQLDRAAPGVTYVAELSSYMLADMTQSPHVAVVTAFFPEHLDYHGSLEAYKDAKANIARHQRPEDVVFYCADSEGSKEIASAGPGRKVPFSAADAPLRIEETKLIGRHNLGNMAGAIAVGEHLGVGRATAVAACKEFEGLPHRLQRLGDYHGIHWVDDAISTTPESAVAALDALGDDVATMILGGQDRGYDFAPLARRLASSGVRTAILFPGSGPRIREAIALSGAKIECADAADMPSAVALARERTQPGEICLLSTASPSYGMFKNFEEKGDRFSEEIRRLV